MATIIEFALIALFVYLQIKTYLSTKNKTELIATFLPNVKQDLSVGQSFVTQASTPVQYSEDGTEITTPRKSTSILRINSKQKNPLLEGIVSSINDYLKNNRGNAADFHLLKNIVDRHLNTIDEEINQFIPVPLYLGLASTMVGIIVGLWSINGDVNSDAFVVSISTVVSSIKYAMMSSLLGLLLTTYLSAIAYRKSKSAMEEQKNDLLDFLQSKLLPHLNEDAVETLTNLQANLKAFNDDFGDHIEGFSSILDDVHKAFDSQVIMVQEMKKMDMVKMSSLNVSVLSQLNKSMAEFEKFAAYLNQMNNFVAASIKLTNSVDAQLKRTDEITYLVKEFKENIENNQLVMSGLSDFLERIDENQALITATETLDQSVAGIMEQMKQNIIKETKTLENHTKQATEDLDLLLNKERGQLDKLKNLDKLNDMVNAVKEMSSNTKNVNMALAQRIAELTQSINDSPVYGGQKSTLPSWISYPLAAIVIITCGCFIYQFILPFIK